MNFNNYELADLTFFDHEEEGFTVDQVIDLFPKQVSTDFEVSNLREANLLFDLITMNPFQVRDTFLNPLSDCRLRSGQQPSARVMVSEDIDLDTSRDGFSMQYPEVEAELLLAKLTR